MKVTIFTSNQPRHISLIDKFTQAGADVHAVLECNTIFPGFRPGFFQKSEIMQTYFSNVIAAEKKLFGSTEFVSPSVKVMSVAMGDLSSIDQSILVPALEADLYIVFGASFIKGWLIEYLTRQKAINIHMGISPYYRGSSCNFWALQHERPNYVGATIHRLSKGLDSGGMLYHAIPSFEGENPFEYSMKAVIAAQLSLVELATSGLLQSYDPIKQDRSVEISYTRNQDFNDNIAAQYLQVLDSPSQLKQKLASTEKPILTRPYFMS